MGETRVVHCACGATREAPIGLKIVSCVRCGREMATSSSAFTPTPPRWIVATATLASQLLGTLVFALALVWIIKHGDRHPGSLMILVLGAVCVFAAGNAHRGSVRALVVCALLDFAVAILCLGNVSVAKVFVAAPVAWAAPAIANQLALAMAIAGGVAVLAASACIAAVPQTRRFAAWRDEQLVHAARAWRG